MKLNILYSNGRLTWNGTGSKTFLVNFSLGGVMNTGATVRVGISSGTSLTPLVWMRLNSTNPSANIEGTTTNLITLSSGEYTEPVYYVESGSQTLSVYTINFTMLSVN